jgi:hypothetical protein
VWSIAAVLCTTFFTFLAMKYMIAKYNEVNARTDVPISPLAVERNLPTDVPMLQVNARAELAVHLEEEQSRIDHYEWIDRASGLVKVPIDRAMKMVVEKGIPEWEPLIAPPESGKESEGTQ